MMSKKTPLDITVEEMDQVNEGVWWRRDGRMRKIAVELKVYSVRKVAASARIRHRTISLRLLNVMLSSEWAKKKEKKRTQLGSCIFRFRWSRSYFISPILLLLSIFFFLHFYYHHHHLFLSFLLLKQPLSKGFCLIEDKMHERTRSSIYGMCVLCDRIEFTSKIWTEWVLNSNEMI